MHSAFTEKVRAFKKKPKGYVYDVEEGASDTELNSNFRLRRTQTSYFLINKKPENNTRR